MPLKDAPNDGQEQQPYAVDKEMVQKLANEILKPYREIANLYAEVPEKKEPKLAELEAVVRETVEHTLAIVHVANVTKTAVTNVRRTMKDTMEEMGQTEFTEENVEQELQRIREEMEAKLAEQSEKAKAERELPPYFDEWCQATTAEVIRIIHQTIDGVN